MALGEALDELVRGTELMRAHVFERRFRFEIDACPAEIDEVLINGAALRSIAVESADADAALRVVAKLGLDLYENVDYARAVRRTMGLEPLSDEGLHG